MPYRPFEGQNCSVAGALSIIGERWTLLVLRELLLGRRRFKDIQRNTGVATNILSDRLQTLVEHGVVERRTSGDVPEYVPTAKGLDAAPVLITLMQWGDRHAAPPGGPPRVHVHTTCGHDADPRLVCGHCGDVLRARELRVRPGPGADEAQLAEPLLPAA
ncbi:MAG TPA: helix-turn-helix domain-containing protein [Baekduia sp.]|nr:helix-turn-helix domain-containing protein [Baekduia sp.]